MIATAPTKPVSWVFAPACSATAVRDPLVLTGKPWKSPAAMFAAPIPTISRFPSTSCPARDANADAVEIVSARETRTMPRAPPRRSGRSESRDVRDRERRESLGSVADEGHAGRQRGRTRARRGSTARRRSSTRGNLRASGAAARRITMSAADPDRERSAHGLTGDEPVDETPELRDEPLGVDREAEHLRKLPNDDRQRESVHVSDRVGIDRRSAMNPSFASPARSMMAPTMRASSDASAIALAGSLSAPISGRIVAA